MHISTVFCEYAQWEWYFMISHAYGLGQDYSNSIANALELLQPFTKQLIYCNNGRNRI